MALKDNLGKIASKAKVVAEKSGDKIASGVDKATDKIDKKTGGKYHDKLEKVDNLASKLDKTAKEGEATTEASAEAVSTEPGPTTPAPTTPAATTVATAEAERDATPPTGTMPS